MKKVSFLSSILTACLVVLLAGCPPSGGIARQARLDDRIRKLEEELEAVSAAVDEAHKELVELRGTPLVVGASQQQFTTPSVDASADSGSPIDPEIPGRQAPSDAAVSDTIAAEDKPDAEAPLKVDSDGDGSNEADRPRSLFRSIGRALQRGITDAAGATSESSNDASEPVESEPTDPR